MDAHLRRQCPSSESCFFILAAHFFHSRKQSRREMLLVSAAWMRKNSHLDLQLTHVSGLKCALKGMRENLHTTRLGQVDGIDFRPRFSSDTIASFYSVGHTDVPFLPWAYFNNLVFPFTFTHTQTALLLHVHLAYENRNLDWFFPLSHFSHCCTRHWTSTTYTLKCTATSLNTWCHLHYVAFISNPRRVENLSQLMEIAPRNWEHA